MSFITNTSKLSGRVLFTGASRIFSKTNVNVATAKPVDPHRKLSKAISNIVQNRSSEQWIMSSTIGTCHSYHTTAIKWSQKGDSGSGEIPKLFAAIGSIISPELVSKTQAVYQFNVKGKEEGVWHLDLKNGEGACGSGEPKHPADATLTMDAKNFADLFAGKLKPTTAFMMGKLKISGDMQKALKLEKLLKSLKTKL